MKKLALVCAVLVGSTSFAQEIGTEINPVTPSSGNNTNNNNNSNNANNNANSNNSNTNSNNANSGNSTYKPKPKEGEKTFEGQAVAAQGGAFGIRAGFGASGSTSVPTTSATASALAAPTVGIAFMATDSFKLLVDLGFGMGLVGSNVVFALGTTVGFDFMFRTPGDALRPFFHGGANFNLVAASSNPAISFGAQLGFGAEYFFSPSFSINGRLMLAVPMALAGSNFILGIFTVTPGVGATWYL
ncbi:MAG: hypothetical protein JNM17_10580 [Archangium sp.]|nr:hypothetical protein [Archangium sp.]